MLQRCIDGEPVYVDDILEASKKYERRMRRKLAIARGYDPRHA
jgi:hypothetical protein